MTKQQHDRRRQHSLLEALHAVTLALQSVDSQGVTITRINSSEYHVTNTTCVYHVSLDDANIFWNIFMLHPLLDKEPAFVSEDLSDCFNWIVDKSRGSKT